MGLINPKGPAARGRVLFFTFLLVRGVALLYGQSPGGLSLAAAIGDIEALLGKSGVSGAERHGALERLARLYQLSGNIEEAARAWTDAAFAEPGKRDDNALLEGAGCYLALGETEKAQASVQTVLLTGRDPGALFKARYLGAQLAAFRFSDTSALITLIDDPDYGKLKPAVYYTLWKISGAETYKNRLLAEYPLSPEARILEEQGIVTADPIALWIFFPGREGIIAGEPVQISSSSSGEKPAAPETGESAAVLQTGLFSREGNARTMVERLKSAGFEPQVARRALRGTDYWAVTVPPGPDINKTILELKNAGFESFPVY